MAYLVLARKWRPKTFTELVGQEHVVKALTNALDRGQLHHAWLLTGTRGVGKTTIARILAKALNCETGVTSVPCGKCSACLEIDSGRFIDLLEMDAASNTRVDDMREVLDNAKYFPTRGRYKVYLIDEVHMLSKSAFNSMLKTLEEPPDHVKFILATTDPQKIPVTVLSRCLQLSLRQMTESDVRRHLAQILNIEQIKFDDAAINLIARAAHGSMRDALSLLDQAIAFGAGEVYSESVQSMLGAVDQRVIYDLLEALAQNSGEKVMQEGDRIVASGLSLDAALADMAKILHKVALAQALPDSLVHDDPYTTHILSLSSSMDAEDVQLYYQIAISGRRDLSLAPDEATGFMMTLLRLWAFTPNQAVREEIDSSKLPSSVLVNKEKDDNGNTERQLSDPEGSQLPENKLIKPLIFDGDWEAFIQQLNLGGMARMLAQHCAFGSHEGGRLVLILPKAHAHLLEGTYQEKLRVTLAPYFKEVSIDIGEGNEPEMTPVMKRERRREALKREVDAAINSDPVIRQLQVECDAIVIDESIVAKE
ncbi:MAG TPA: DNA polymerase III subunit gamma/tau [Burkholderiales bacterium]|nr:DNA polymerase III subunit gamma/tau [Burkholderiales bacterium]